MSISRESLLLDLLDSEDPNLREIYLANFSLEEPSSSLVHRIIHLARHDASRKVRETAVKVLARFWPKEVVVNLYSELLRSENVDTITAVIKAMQDLSDTKSLELLFDLYRQRGDFQVRAAVLVALSRRPFARVKEFLVANPLVDRDEFIRAMTVTVIGRRGGKDVLPVLETCLSDPDPRVRSNALESMARYADHMSDDLFLQALDDPHHRVKISALKALHRKGWGGVRRKVDELMVDPADSVRASVKHFLNAVEGLLDLEQEAAATRVIH